MLKRSLNKMYNINSKFLIAIFLLFTTSLVLIDKYEKKSLSVQYIFDGLMEKRKLETYDWGSDPKYTGTIFVSQPTLDVLNANYLCKKDSIIYVSKIYDYYLGFTIISPICSNMVLCTDVHNITRVLCCPGWSIARYCREFNSLKMGDVSLSLNLESLDHYLDSHIQTYLHSNHIFLDHAEKFQLNNKKNEIIVVSESGKKYKLRLKAGEMERIGIIRTRNEIIEWKTTGEKLMYSAKTLIFLEKLNNEILKLFFLIQ